MKFLPPMRKTVAILVDYMNLFAGGYEADFRKLFERAAQARDINLMFVYGRAIDHPDPGFAAHNRVYDLVSPARVDGVITLSSAITSFCGLAGAVGFFKRYAALARCSVGLAVPGVPSIAVDNRSGMTKLVDHLIALHGYRRIAFIRGPADNVEANARFDAYREVLARHGIGFDDRLVEDGDFSRSSGNVAVTALLARGSKPDAIIAVNDGMALGAISELRSHGYQVPRDVAVTGFDDLVMARLGDPPLTTVSQPLQDMVELAVRSVLQQLEGEPTQELIPLPTLFVVRQSCGCQQSTLGSVAQANLRPGVDGRQQIAEHAGAMSQLLSADNGASDNDNRDLLRIVHAVKREFDGQPESLMREMETILTEIEENEQFQTLQMAIGRLRCDFAPITTPELDDLWYRACTLVALTSTRKQEQLRLDHDQEYYRWVDVGERFGAALDLTTLTFALAGALLAIGIEHAYVSRYVDGGQRTLDCFVALRDGVAYAPSQRRFNADALVPDGAFPESRRTTFLVFPLAFNGRNLGVAVFESRRGVSGYQIFRDRISAVMQSIALHQDILEQTTLHERRIQEQERQATAKRIQSLSVLAGGVAHDLNNVLGPLVALPDLIVEQLEQGLLGNRATESEIRADLDTMKTATLRASQTIKDLLTLGRQGHTAKESLDLNLAMSRCIAHETQRSIRASGRITLQLCEESPFIHGSETHIGRAVTNLVRNGLEAMDVDGTVVVRTAILDLVETTAGFETVPAGSYAVVSVSDPGRGIVAADIGRLFEPFYSQKRLSDHSGSGLGLAIVHGVVKEHGGFINVESVVGRGTTFTLYFPRTSVMKQVNASASEVPRGNARILVVDDEPVQLRTCRRVLSSLGYQIDTLSSGREAYALFEAHAARREVAGGASNGGCPYDLVIMDMLLNEDEDGMQVFDKMRALYPQQKGIVASGHAPSQLLQLAMQRGLAWLAKPYTRPVLARAVHAALFAGGPPETAQAT